MGASEFKLFTGEELISQIQTGVDHIGSPFELKEPTKDLELDAIALVKAHFKESRVLVDVCEESGYTVFAARLK